MSRRRWARPPGARWLALAVFAVVLALAVAWVLFVPAADWLARHDVGSAHGALLQTARDDARGRLLTLGAGLLAAGALVFTARNFTLARRNSEQADQWQRRTHELTEQGQVTDRYTKAIEQLGSDKLDVRIGGIYALERVARDSARDHPTVMEVLTAFIREHSREPWPEPDPGDQEQEQSVRPDVQAAVTVVGRRDPARDVQRIDLYRAKLLAANLARANFTGAYLFGADLDRVKLFRANLSGADLTHANLTRVYLSEADLTCADLSGTDLTGSYLGGANFTGADLTGTDLSHAYLSRADLTHAKLTRADLSGADLSGADLSGAYLNYAKLHRAKLLAANFAGADLSEADLSEADLTGTDLGAADLTCASWPEDETVPRGWKRNPESGQLSWGSS